MKVICIIPARGGSKGLPGKNIRLLAGKPLISWPIKAAKVSGVIDKIFVTTDCSEIAKYAIAAGAEVPFLRPSYLAEDLSTTENTLQNALLAFEQYCETHFDIAVFLTATDVFRDPEWIREAVWRLRENTTLESAFSANKTTKNYWHKNQEGAWERVLPWMSEYSSRQIRSAIYREDTGLACASRAYLWRKGRRIGDVNHLIINNNPETNIDIHTELDHFLAEATITFFKKNNPARAHFFEMD